MQRGPGDPRNNGMTRPPFPCRHGKGEGYLLLSVSGARALLVKMFILNLKPYIVTLPVKGLCFGLALHALIFLGSRALPSLEP